DGHGAHLADPLTTRPGLRRPGHMAAGALLQLVGRIAVEERRVVALAFCSNFLLFGSYYILRPVRDTVATVAGIGELQLLFTGTFIGSLLAAPLYAALASHLRLSRL